MIDFGYSVWKESCEEVFNYAKTHGKYYIQLYPFLIISNFDEIKSEEYYNLYVKTGAILIEKNNLITAENYTMRSDGSFRKRYLMSPIIFLYYISIGKYIYLNYKNIRNTSIETFYSGNFSEKELHYQKEYTIFSNRLEMLSSDYKYYIKVDIKEFFNNINLLKVKNKLLEKTGSIESEAFVIEYFLKFFGNGEMPQTECGITSSYISTVIYLGDADNKIYDFLCSYNKISNFKMIRYVDDLYIFINKKNDKDRDSNIENTVINKINTIFHDIDLCVNKEKSEMKTSKRIYEDIHSVSLLDEDSIDEEIDDIVRKNLVLKFIDKLTSVAIKDGIVHSEYLKLVNECFYSKQTLYFSSQIYNALIYKNSKWLTDAKTLNALVNALEIDQNIVANDPKRLTALIVNTKNPDLIRKMLAKQFEIFRAGNWSIYNNYIAMQYLLYSDFKHIDLLSVLKQKDNDLYLYINNFCKQQWVDKTISPLLIKFVKKCYLKDSNFFYLKFMSIVEWENGNIFLSYSLHKNCFDVMTAHFANCIGKNPKFSIDSYYKKNSLKNFYKEFVPEMETEIEDIIEKMDKLRNGNPVCHGKGEIITDLNLKKKIVENMNSLDKITKKFITDKI